MISIYKKIIFLFLAIITLSSISCNKDEEDQLVGEERLKKYIDKNYQDLEPEESEIYFIKQKTGNGKNAVTGDSIYITFNAYYITDNSEEKLYTNRERDNPLKFQLGQANSVIKGLEEGIKMMRENDTAILIIPYDLGYGAVKTGTVPAYSPLKIYVELLICK